MKFSPHKKFRQGLNNQHILFSVLQEKKYHIHIQFFARYKTELEKSHYCQHVNMVEWQVSKVDNHQFE